MATSNMRLTGSVKWFNNKAGFGFITVCGDSEYKEKDVFVHYSSLRLDQEKYKYLVQGEYVEFLLSTASKDSHEYQATDVTGICEGPIMCEVRRLNRYSDKENEDHGNMETNPPPIRRTESTGPRPPRSDAAGFVPVQKRNRRRVVKQ